MKVQEGKPYQKHTGKITRSACAVGEINGDNADTLNCEIKKAIRETVMMSGLLSQRKTLIQGHFQGQRQ